MLQQPNSLAVDSAMPDSGEPLDEWVLAMLQQQGPQWLHQLEDTLHRAESAQLIVAIDRLTRRGDISLWPLAHGNYLLMPRRVDSPPGSAMTTAQQ